MKLLKKTQRKTIKKDSARAPSIPAFQKVVMRHFKEHGRHDLPWRKTTNPYRILVSEIMLQQTQVPRVIEKYKEFLKVFPTIRILAGASLSDVLKHWSGLGYNRRAKFLHEAAKIVVKEHKGHMPKIAEELEQLPGIGPYTARAIAAFAYNIPSVFIETNIRAVFIHHFFPDREKVHDRELLPLIEDALGKQDPREWYGALMDYGSYLKQTVGNASRRSAHHVKQKAFKGSLREVRGGVVKVLKDGPLTSHMLSTKFSFEKNRIEGALKGLEKDGIIRRVGRVWRIA